MQKRLAADTAPANEIFASSDEVNIEAVPRRLVDF